MQIKSISGLATESFTLQIGQPAQPPVLTPDSTDNKVGRNIDIIFVSDVDWSSQISNIKVNDVSIREKYTISNGNISILA